MTCRFADGTSAQLPGGAPELPLLPDDELAPPQTGAGRAQKSRMPLIALHPSCRFSDSSCPDCDKKRRSVCRARAPLPAPARPPGRPGAAIERRASRPGRATARKTSPTGFSGFRRPGPRCPCRRPPTSAPSSARAPSAMASATSAETAPCSSRSVTGTPSCVPFTSFGVRDHAADEDVARPGDSVSRAAIIPPVHDSAVGERQARAPAEVERRSPRRGARRAGKRKPLERAREAGVSSPAPRLRHRARRRRRRGSRGRGRRRSPRPPRLTPGLVEDARHRRLRRHRRTAATRRSGGRASGRAAGQRGCRERVAARVAGARPAVPGGRSPRPPSCSTRIAGAVPASPSDDARPPAATPACGCRAGSRRRAAGAVPRRARQRLDLRRELLVDDERPPDRGREQLDGAVVVGRAQAAGGDAEIRLEPRLQSAAQLVRPVADDDHALRLEPELQLLRAGTGPLRSVGRRGRARCR